MPEGYSGRAFASASLVRASKDAARFLKAYARTIEPVSINMSARTLGISLEAPDTVADARALKVTVKTDVPARVFLWAVDTGILSLTGYRTPSPVHALLEDRALQVDTRQTLEGLMPEGMKLPGEAPFGGGFASKSLAADAMANPFRRTMDRAAVWWAGSLETDSAGRTATVSLPPNSTAACALMAAGAAEGRAGARFDRDRRARPLDSHAHSAGLRRAGRRLHGRRLPQRRGALEGRPDARPARSPQELDAQCAACA